MPWKRAKKRGMMAIPLEIDRYFKMSFTFMPVMRSVKGESLDEPSDAFFRAASRISPAISRIAPPTRDRDITFPAKSEIALNN